MTPGAPVENSGNGGEQDVAPVEVRGALVEMRQAEKHSGEDEGGDASHTSFEEVLQPSAKEKLFGHGDQEEREREGGESAGRAGHDGMQVKEAGGEPDDDGDGRVEEEFAPANAEVARAQAEVESDSVELADAEEGVDAGIEQKDFIEGDEARRPCGLEPAEIDSEAEDDEDEEVAPIAALVGIGATGAVEQGCNGNGQQRVESDPPPLENVCRAGDERVGNAEQRGEQEPRACGSGGGRADSRTASGRSRDSPGMNVPLMLL